jgi:predicted short-subunit dehydrogenase-like oxidoreductase (DUF2520 family)
LRVIGAGRAGGALMGALGEAGWRVRTALGRHDDPAPAAVGVDLLVIATPDDAIADTARRVRPEATTVVAHLSGSLGLEVLVPHARRAGLHPLVALPDASVGARRLRGAWFATAGDPVVDEVVTALEGRAVAVSDEQRVLYHAAACVASNHLVALLGSVQRIAEEAGVPLAAYLDLVRSTVDNVDDLGPAAALTGPVARGDEATVARHRSALARSTPDELAAYDVMVALARRLRP